MQTYKYTAKDLNTGRQIKAMIQAESKNAVAKIVKDGGMAPLTISLEGAYSSKSVGGFFSRVKSKDKVLFARQLSTLINAGLPLTQSLRSVADQTTSKPLRSIINEIIVDVEAGKSLSSSLAKHPKAFNRVFVNLVQAGETSGTLDQELERIAIQQEKDADIVSKVRGALIYPAVVVCVMIAVVVFMIIKVVPQIQLLYTSFPGATLPIETRLLIDLSKLITGSWWIILIVIAIVGILLTRWLRTESGTKTLDTLKISTPPFKSLFMKIYMARFSRTSASLIGAGVPLLDVLEITADTVANYRVKTSISKASEKVKGGTSLGDALTGDPYFLPLVPNMLKIGEKSGSVEAMMTKSADYYETEVENIVKNISTIIEPIMMVLLGIVAITIVIAILLPIYGLAGSGAINGTGAQ